MVLGCALVVSGCKFGVLTPAGPVGSADATIMLDSLAIMLAIVIPTIGAGLSVVVPRIEHARALHAGLRLFRAHRTRRLSIPILVILFLGGSIWITESMNTNMMPMGPPLVQP